MPLAAVCASLVLILLTSCTPGRSSKPMTLAHFENFCQVFPTPNSCDSTTICGDFANVLSTQASDLDACLARCRPHQKSSAADQRHQQLRRNPVPGLGPVRPVLPPEPRAIASRHGKEPFACGVVVCLRRGGRRAREGGDNGQARDLLRLA